MADISRFSSSTTSRTNVAQAALDARARKSAQKGQNENGTAGVFRIADAPASNKSAAPAHKGYLDQEEVSFRARVMNQDETPENIRALARLKRTFDSGQPLRGDVPRGYYLNLRV